MTAARYEIGGITYIQRPLMLGRLIELLEKIDYPSLGAQTSFGALMRHVVIESPELISLVLVDEQGNRPDPAMLREHLSLETLEAVGADFFGFNPVLWRLIHMSAIMVGAPRLPINGAGPESAQTTRPAAPITEPSTRPPDSAGSSCSSPTETSSGPPGCAPT